MKLFKLRCISFIIVLFSLQLLNAQERRSYTKIESLEKSSIDDYWHYHNVGNLGLTVTNYGILGEGYNNPDQPSCMYKL